MTSFFGNNVGRAYIEILADGNRFPESVREEFDKNDPEKEFKKQGEEHGEAYGEGLAAGRERGYKRGVKGQKDPLANKEITDALKRDKGAFKGVEDYFEREGERIAKQFRSGLKTGNKDLDRDIDVIAKRAINRLKEKTHASGQGLSFLEDFFRAPAKADIGPQKDDESPEQYRERAREAQEAYNAEVRRQAARRRAFLKSERDRFLRDDDSMWREAERQLREHNAAQEKEDKDRLQAMIDRLHTQVEEFRKSQDEMERLNRKGGQRIIDEDFAAREEAERERRKQFSESVRNLVRESKFSEQQLADSKARLQGAIGGSAGPLDGDQQRELHRALQAVEDEEHRSFLEREHYASQFFDDQLRHTTYYHDRLALIQREFHYEELRRQDAENRGDLRQESAHRHRIGDLRRRLERENYREEQREEKDRQTHILASLRKQLSDRAALYDNITNRRLKDRTTAKLRGDRIDPLTGKIESILARGERLQRQVQRGDTDEAEKFLNELRVLNGKLFSGRQVGGIRPFLRDLSKGETKLKRLDDQVDVVGKRIGRVFGQGSRNNFLNFFGGLVGGITTGVLNAPIKLARGFLALKHDVRTAWREGDTLIKKFGNVASVLSNLGGKVLAGFIGAIGGTIGILNVLVLILGPLASLISGLTAGVLALASAIGYGLIASLVAAGPLLLGLATGVGVVVSAFAGFRKLDKDVRAQILKPLEGVKTQLKSLQEQTREGLFSQLPAQGKILESVLKKNITPLFRDTSKSMAGVGTSILKAFNSKPATHFFHDFNRFLNGTKNSEGALGRFGQTLNNWLQGALTYIRLALPYADKLSKNMLKSAQHFNSVTNSAKGKNKVAKFFKDAQESGHKLWITLRLTGRVLKDLLKPGKDTGDSLIDLLNKNLRRFDKFLKSKNGGPSKSLQDFYGQVIPLFKAMGTFLGGLGHFFAKLDSPTSRAILNGLLTKLGQIFDFISDLVPEIQTFQDSAGRAFGDLLRAVQPLARLFLQSLGYALKIIAPLMSGLADGIEHVLDFLGPFKTLIAAVASPILAAAIAMATLRKAVSLLGITTAAANVKNVATGIAGFVSNIVTSLRLGTAKVLTARERLGAAVAGIGIALGGMAIGNEVGGASGTAISALSGAAGGALAGSAFGPWGAAIGGLIGGVGGLITGLNNSGDAAKAAAAAGKQAAEEQKQAVDSLIESLKGVEGQYNANYRAAIVSQLQDKGLFSPVGKTGAYQGLKDGKAQYAVDKVSVDPKLITDYALGLADVNDIYKALGISASEANAVLNESDDAAKLGPEGDRQLRKFLQDLGIVANNASKAETGFQQFQRAMDDTVVPARLLAKGTKGLSGALKGLGTDLYDSTKAHDRQSAATGRSNKVVKEFVGSFRDAYKTQVQYGVGVKTATATYNANIASLKETLKNLGFMPDEIAHVVGAYDKLPKVKNTNVTLTGDEAKTRIREIQGLINNIRQGKVPGLTADSAGGRAAIAALQDEIDNLRGKTVDLAGNLEIGVHISKNGNEVDVGHSFRLYASAAGRLVNGPMVSLLGEAGPEAVVPLNRPLSQVDPSVRWLSAIAQGKSPANGNAGAKFASGGVISGGKTVTIHPGAIQVITPSTDPRAVAAETVNRIATNVMLG